MRLLEDILDTGMIMAISILFGIGVLILVITSPIWLLPYIIYKKIKYGYI